MVARRVSESVLASQLLSVVRDQKWDLDEIDNELARLHPDKVSLKGSMSSDEVKAAKTQAAANYIVECLQPFAVTSSASSSSDQILLIAEGPTGPKSSSHEPASRQAHAIVQ